MNILYALMAGVVSVILLAVYEGNRNGGSVETNKGLIIGHGIAVSVVVGLLLYGLLGGHMSHIP